MSGHYDKLGIQFLYPENWQIADEETQSWPRSVSVHSPGGGFWSLLVYDDGAPDELVLNVKSAMQAEYDDLEASECVEQFGDYELRGYDMYFYCLDLLVSARAVAVRAASQTYLLIWQGEDNEFSELEPVFRAITTSLFRFISEMRSASALSDQRQA